MHVVCDNYATHNHPNVRSWLQRNPRVRLQFTPTSGSWLNLVAAIERFIDAWNDRCEPFTWTKNPDEILAKAQPKVRPTSAMRHELAELSGN